MDRSLDDRIVEQQRARSSRRGGRYEGPRDGIRKPRSREPRSDIDQDWVHDRYEDDKFSRPSRNDRYTSDRTPDARNPEGTRLRVDNLHYELTERDITELFTRIGPIAHIQLLYDRMDRSRGIAFVTYESARDATAAVRDFDGANAFGQPIRLTLAAAPPAPRAAPMTGRSLFERIDAPRRARSHSPDRRRPGPPPEGVDRYVPRGARAQSRDSPPRRARTNPRTEGRRPGERRETTRGAPSRGRGGRGRGRDENGRQVVQGRPRKTAEELDEEMADYFGGEGEATGSGTMNGAPEVGSSIAQPGASVPAGGAVPVDEDVDMIE